MWRDILLWKENIREFMKRIRQRPVRSGGSDGSGRMDWTKMGMAGRRWARTLTAIALLAQTLAAQNVPPPPAPHAHTVPVTMPTRLREPDTFDSSDTSKLRVFILQCNLHFQDHANAFTSDRAKVVYALSYLQLFA